MATTISVDLPRQLVADLDSIARSMGVSREVALRVFISRYSETERRWEQLQKWGQESARNLGIETEDDLEKFVDSQAE